MIANIIKISLPTAVYDKKNEKQPCFLLQFTTRKPYKPCSAATFATMILKFIHRKGWTPRVESSLLYSMITDVASVASMMARLLETSGYIISFIS